MKYAPASIKANIKYSNPQGIFFLTFNYSSTSPKEKDHLLYSVNGLDGDTQTIYSDEEILILHNVCGVSVPYRHLFRHTSLE